MSEAKASFDVQCSAELHSVRLSVVQINHLLPLWRAILQEMFLLENCEHVQDIRGVSSVADLPWSCEKGTQHIHIHM